MADPLISIIVPVYKVEAFLDECIESIVNQTIKDIEIILVDDGSPDRCPQMCDAWVQKDPRIRVIHKKNAGASSARNAGLNAAKGRYIGFVDSDDYIAKNMYEELLGGIQSSDKGMACCGAVVVSEDGKVLYNRGVPVQRIMSVDRALDSVFYLEAEVSVWSKLYHREVFERLRFPEGETNEDFPVMVPSVVMAQGMVHVQQCLYYYRQRSGSITKTGTIPEEKSLLVYKNLHKIKDQLTENGIAPGRSYGFFSAQYSFYHALVVEKAYLHLSDKVKQDNLKYRRIMWKYLPVYLFARHSTLKDKILYLLVLSHLLRPVYRVFYRKHL